MNLADIIGEIKAANFFSVLADEVSSHNVEHLPIFVFTLLTRNAIFLKNLFHL